VRRVRRRPSRDDGFAIRDGIGKRSLALVGLSEEKNLNGTARICGGEKENKAQEHVIGPKLFRGLEIREL
jgi:hypothetical protein